MRYVTPTGNVYVASTPAVTVTVCRALTPARRATPSTLPWRAMASSLAWSGRMSRATLYRTGLAADVINGAQSPAVATGVLSCSVTTPAADVTPAAKTVVILGTLLVTP